MSTAIPGQLMFTDKGIKSKVDMAIDRLRLFEPEDGYYVAFSGGKDSQCVYHLCKMAGVKFDAHYSVTSVDPPPRWCSLSKSIIQTLRLTILATQTAP